MSTSTIVTTPQLTEAEQKQADQLARIWDEPRGFLGWFKAVHHTTIGRRYVLTAFAFFLVAGLLAGVMMFRRGGETHPARRSRSRSLARGDGCEILHLYPCD